MIQNSSKFTSENINYLSNYTLVLISDIIQYVSNSINLRLNKSEIILKEVLEFGFNVLKTLVDCNENKVNKIELHFNLIRSIYNKFYMDNYFKNHVKFQYYFYLINKYLLK